MKLFIIFLEILVLSLSVYAESTFFDDPNDALILGNVRRDEGTEGGTKGTEGGAAPEECQRGSARVQGLCIKVIKAGNENTSMKKNISTQPASRENEAVDVVVRTVQKNNYTNGRTAPPDKESLILPGTGILGMLIFLFFLWQRRRGQHH